MRRMKRALFLFLAATRFCLAQADPAAGGAPTENRYDIVGKVFAPICNVLLAGGKGADLGMSFHMVMKDVTGRLPKDFNGATLDAAAEFPDKVKLVAPVLGEQVTVCRNGGVVWATPGAKIEYLLGQFKGRLPRPVKAANSPIFVPITAQQAIFLPAVFVLDEGKEYADVDGEPTRVIQGGLMPELARSTKAEDLRATIWVGAGHVPKQIKIVRRDFTATVEIRDLEFAPRLPAATWQPPAGSTDIFKTTPDVLQQLLFVVMNSVNVKPPGAAPAPQQP